MTRIQQTLCLIGVPVIFATGAREGFCEQPFNWGMMREDLGRCHVIIYRQESSEFCEDGRVLFHYITPCRKYGNPIQGGILAPFFEEYPTKPAGGLEHDEREVYFAATGKFGLRLECNLVTDWVSVQVFSPTDGAMLISDSESPRVFLKNANKLRDILYLNRIKSVK